MNNKILSIVLVVGIASTWFAGISAANSGTTISDITEKVESGIKWMSHDGNKFGKRKGLKNLTEDERQALESMTDEEKKAFFDAKKETMKAEKEASRAVVAKLMNGKALTADEEATRLALLAKLESRVSEWKPVREWAELTVKILAGDELTAEDEAALAEKKAKHEEREARKAIIEPIKAKLDAGEELTDEEQALLDEAKSNKKGKKGHGKRER